jgi:hypothetical protein
VHYNDMEFSFLFTGDAETKSEADMLKFGPNLKSDVLMIGRHGSKSSTSQKFLDAVNPKYTVIQVGKDNNYGHPTAEVLKKLNDKKLKIYKNDEQGNVIFISNGKDITVTVAKSAVTTQKPTAKPTPKPSNEPNVDQGDMCIIRIVRQPRQQEQLHYTKAILGIEALSIGIMMV